MDIAQQLQKDNDGDDYVITTFCTTQPRTVKAYCASIATPVISEAHSKPKTDHIGGGENSGVPSVGILGEMQSMATTIGEVALVTPLDEMLVASAML